MTGWRKRQVLEMALEAGFADEQGTVHAAYQLEAFAELVRADERERIKEESQRCYVERGQA